jgi:fimbrial chaperone protein
MRTRALKRLIAALTLLLAAWVLAGADARAQGLNVAPTTVDLLPGQITSTLTVSNRGTDLTEMQVRAFAWTQNANGDQLTPTESLVVSPPIFQVPGAASQLVRLVLRKPPGPREETYRLLINQLPTPGVAGMQFTLAFSVPIFAEPDAQGGPDMDFHVAVAGGTAQLVAANHGIRRDRIVAPSLTFRGAKLTLKGNTNFYVLAGSEQRWDLTGKFPALGPGSTVRLQATALSGHVDRAVPVSPE